MNVLTTTPNVAILKASNERSERATLLEELRQWQGMERNAHSQVTRIQRRLAEIEAAKVLQEQAA